MANQSGSRTGRIVFSVLMMVAWALVISASAQSRRYSGEITVFTNPNFSGQSVTFRNDMPDLRGYSLNDKISSIEIANGEAWEVCQDINYGNRCQVLTGSVSDLRGMGWNDRISSLRRVNSGYNGRRTGGVFAPNGSYGSYGAQRLVLYDRTNFRGNAITLNGNDNNGIGNRQVGSAEVRGGTWELCDRSGRCATVSQDVPDLSRLGLNSRITEARPVYQNNNDNGWYNGNNGRGRGYGRRRN